MFMLLAMLGCVEEEIVCTTEMRSSVSLLVHDDSGAVIPDTTVSYTVDGGVSKPCESWTAGEWVCGWEEAGSFEITAVAPGFDPKVVEVVVEADVCHVISQVADVVLVPTCGEADPAPSVIATVAGSSGESLADVAVVYSQNGSPEVACQPDGDTWTCGWGSSGTFAVTASAGGHVPERWRRSAAEWTPSGRSSSWTGPRTEGRWGAQSARPGDILETPWI
jgi:hypothetical protein